MVFKLSASDELYIEDDDIREALLADEERVYVTANQVGKEFFAGYPQYKRHMGYLRFTDTKSTSPKVTFHHSRRSQQGYQGFMLEEITVGGYYVCLLMGSRPWLATVVHATSERDAVGLVMEGFPIQDIKPANCKGMGSDNFLAMICDHFNRNHLNNRNHPVIAKVLSSHENSRILAFWISARNQLQLDDWCAHTAPSTRNNEFVRLLVDAGTADCKLVVNPFKEGTGTPEAYYQSILDLFKPL